MIASVSVIVPNLNGKELLSVCLASLQNQTYRDFEVIVVDNGSTDDSISWLRKEYPQIIVISLPKNFGFAKAVNRGILRASGKFIALVNNDTKLDRLWLATLVEYILAHPEAMSVCGKILRMKDAKQIDNVGDIVNCVGQAHARGSGEIDRGQYEAIEEVFCVTGGASLWRKDIFREVGLFDERFFAFFEDVDMGFRLRERNLRSYYIPKAICWHEHGATAKRNEEQTAYLHFRNTWILILKHFPMLSLCTRGRFWKLPLIYIRTIKHFVALGFYKEVLAVQLYWIFHGPGLMLSHILTQRSRTLPFGRLDRWLVNKEVILPWRKQVLSS